MRTTRRERGERSQRSERGAGRSRSRSRDGGREGGRDSGRGGRSRSTNGERGPSRLRDPGAWRGSNWGMAVTQPIDAPGLRSERARGAEAGLAVAEAGVSATRNELLAQVRAAFHDILRREEETALAGEDVRISVADNGAGVAPENLSRIREPLFTTKSFGTGLGLPAVEQILAQHGGKLDISSTVGQGTEIGRAHV